MVAPPSHPYSRPSRSKLRPFAQLVFSRKTVHLPVRGSYCMIRLCWMCVKYSTAPSHAGPSLTAPYGSSISSKFQGMSDHYLNYAADRPTRSERDAQSQPE